MIVLNVGDVFRFYHYPNYHSCMSELGMITFAKVDGRIHHYRYVGLSSGKRFEEIFKLPLDKYTK